jgi:PAS domain-containing protein
MTKSDLDPALESGDSKKVEPPLNKDFDIESLPEPQQKWLREYTSQLAAANEELQKEIAARKQTELLLRESEELYRVTLSYVSDAVFLTDDTGRFTFVCPNVEEIFGYNN